MRIDMSVTFGKRLNDASSAGSGTVREDRGILWLFFFIIRRV